MLEFNLFGSKAEGKKPSKLAENLGHTSPSLWATVLRSGNPRTSS